MRRLKRFGLTGEGLTTVLQGQVRVLKGIPLDGRYRGMAHDTATNRLVIYIEHPSFEPVPEGEKLPDGEIVVEVIR